MFETTDFIITIFFLTLVQLKSEPLENNTKRFNSHSIFHRPYQNIFDFVAHSG